MQLFRTFLIIVLSVATLSSCHISRKRNPTTGPVVIVKDSRAGHHTGHKKGWTKNPNNPHHPRTTNPGHTKNGKAGNTVIIVNNNNTTVKQAAPKGNPGKGGKQHNNGNGNQGKGGKGKGN